MEKYVITTENTADLPYSYYKEHQVEYMYLTYQLDGITYNKENELDFKEFYSRMRAGSMPTTSQVNSEEAKDVLRPLLEAGNDVLHLAFSSGLSGSYNSVRLAAEELKEEYPDRKIYIYVSGDGITDVKNDLSLGDYWILDKNREIDGQLAYCTMESAYYNIKYRKNHMEAMFSIPLFNPEGYDYSDTTEYFKYLYNEDNQEEAYFIGDEPALDDIDDEARIFSLLMTEDEKGIEILDKAPKIRQKALYIRDVIQFSFETVDTTAYWNRHFAGKE